jgi:pre-rRNA-processing protein TSR4
MRGIRGIKQSKVKTSTKSSPPQVKDNAPPVNVGATLFGTSSSNIQGMPFANPFSASNSFSHNSANPFAGASLLAAKPAQRTDIDTLPKTFAEKVRIVASDTAPAIPRPHEPWPSESKFPPPYPSLHLDAEFETLSAPSTPQMAHKIPVIEASDSGGGGKEDKDLYESAMDKTFQKFADRVAQNPEQVIRYEFSGSPLLYSAVDPVGKLLSPLMHKSEGKVIITGGEASRIPRCENCGALRVFEVQLTPHAIAVLEEDEMSVDGMDWGTIILAVCSKDCKAPDTSNGEVGYLEEWVGVQWEELEERER